MAKKNQTKPSATIPAPPTPKIESCGSLVGILESWEEQQSRSFSEDLRQLNIHNSLKHAFGLLLAYLLAVAAAVMVRQTVFSLCTIYVIYVLCSRHREQVTKLEMLCL